MSASTDSLARKTARGAVWMFCLRVSDRGLGLVRTIILARLLAPNDFGVMGIALLMLSGLEVASTTGIDAALIQKKGNVRNYLNAAWTIQFARGALLATILYLTAPLVAIFFNEPRVISVLQVLALSELIKGCQNIAIVYFQKEFEFHKEFAYRLTNTLVKLAVSIPAALMLGDAMALALGVVIGDLVSCALSYRLHPYRPQLRTDWTRMKELFGFGKWVFGSSVLVFLCNQGDDIFLGKVLGASALGLYQMAYLISNLPATEISHVASRVAFPAYARLQDEPERLREMHLAVLRSVALASMPIAAGIMVLAPDFTELFLGPKWEPMVPVMQLLVLWGLMRSVGAPIGALLQGSGRPQIQTKLQFVKLVLLAICIYPMTKLWGMTGTAMAVVVHTLPIELFVHGYVVRMLKCRAARYLQSLVLPFLASIVMFAVLFAAKNYDLVPRGPAGFASLVCLGVVTYAGIIGLLEWRFHYGLREMLSRVNRRRPAFQ